MHTNNTLYGAIKPIFLYDISGRRLNKHVRKAYQSGSSQQHQEVEQPLSLKMAGIYLQKGCLLHKYKTKLSSS